MIYSGGIDMKNWSILYVSAERAMFWSRCFINCCSKEKKTVAVKIKKCLIRNILHKNYNIIIGDESIIGKDILFPHPQNIVIGSGVKLGDNCIVYQDVTMGQNRGKYPSIGDNVIIYPGVKIIGDIKIGNNVIVGANSVVTDDVEENSIVAGVPAKIVGIRRKEDEFY